jgi:hypothetical protein
MVVAPLSWALRVWVLPVLTVLCPSERFYKQQGRRHHPWTARAGQMLRLVVRWVPAGALVFVANSNFAALALRDPVKTVPRTVPRTRLSTRLRLDAALSDPLPPRPPRTRGRPRLTGKRRPTLEAVWADEKTRWTPVSVE